MLKKALTIFLLLTLTLALFGCSEEANKDPLLGKWNWYSVINVDTGKEELASETDVERVWLFNEDGTGSDTISRSGMQQSVTFNWSKTDSTVTINLNVYGSTQTVVYSYTLSGDTLRVKVADERDNTVILKRAK